MFESRKRDIVAQRADNNLHVHALPQQRSCQVHREKRSCEEIGN